LPGLKAEAHFGFIAAHVGIQQVSSFRPDRSVESSNQKRARTRIFHTLPAFSKLSIHRFPVAFESLVSPREPYARE
jgi:hypothetical protein